MFVPRAVRLKGTQVSKKAHDKPSPTNANTGEASTEGQLSTVEQRRNGNVGKGPRFTPPQITPQYLGQLVCGIELLFTDYAHQDEDGNGWLEEHRRMVDGKGGYIHLSAMLEHSNISTLKPAATMLYLQRALREYSSPHLELSSNGYYVRRRPSTYPLRFVPEDSFDIVNDDGLGFWDQRTIYVEPHLRDLCKTPAKAAYWLQTEGQMRDKWLPIQAVHTMFNSCAFVVLSGNVTHEDIWQKWRALDKPEWWKIMTKVEHTKRTVEYQNLLRDEKAARRPSKSNTTGSSANPAPDVSNPQKPAETPKQNQMKRPVEEETAQVAKKRMRSKKKKKGKSAADLSGEDAVEKPADSVATPEGAQDREQTAK